MCLVYPARWNDSVVGLEIAPPASQSRGVWSIYYYILVSIAIFHVGIKVEVNNIILLYYCVRFTFGAVTLYIMR